MYDNFLKLDNEKQRRIINASLKIFAKTLYKNALTDDIVKIANISKGSLFNYFKSKRDLYLYVFDHSVGVITKEFYDKLDLSEEDIFEKYENVFQLKLKLLKTFPDIFDFLINSLSDESIEFKEELVTRYGTAKNYNIIFSNIDKSKFRSDIDVDAAIKMIELTFTGYGNGELSNMTENGVTEELQNKWINDFKKYIKIMKKIYYRGE